MSRKLNISRVRSKKKELQSRKSGASHKLEADDKTHWFFFLPPWSNAGDIWKEIWKHGFKGGNCPEKAGLRNCPLCKEFKKRKAAGDEEFTKSYYLQPQSFVNAIRVEDVKSEDAQDVKVLRLTPTMFNDIVDYILDGSDDGSDDVVDITDMKQAVRIGIRKYKTNNGVRYKDVKFGNRPSDISSYMTPEFLNEALINLDTYKFCQPSSDKDLRSVFQSTDDGFGEDSGYGDNYDSNSDSKTSDEFKDDNSNEDFKDSNTNDFEDDTDFKDDLDTDTTDDLDDDLSLDDEEDLLGEESLCETLVKEILSAKDMPELKVKWAKVKEVKTDLDAEEMAECVEAKNKRKDELKSVSVPASRPSRKKR